MAAERPRAATSMRVMVSSQMVFEDALNSRLVRIFEILYREPPSLYRAADHFLGISRFIEGLRDSRCRQQRERQRYGSDRAPIKHARPPRIGWEMRGAADAPSAPLQCECD